jgi:hypothetical protein
MSDISSIPKKKPPGGGLMRKMLILLCILALFAWGATLLYLPLFASRGGLLFLISGIFSLTLATSWLWADFIRPQQG